MATQRQDTFIRAAVASGFGTATDGNTWTINTGDKQSTNGTQGLISGSSGSTFATLGAALSSADVDVSIRWSVASGQSTSGLLARYQSQSDYYLARYDGAGNIQFFKSVAGVHTVVGSYALTPAINALYWIRFRVQGSTISIRTWADGSSEPSTWNYTATDTSQAAAGKVGLYGFAYGNNVYDSFLAQDIPGAGVTQNGSAAATGTAAASLSANLTTQGYQQGTAAATGTAAAALSANVAAGSSPTAPVIRVTTKSESWSGGPAGSPGTATVVSSEDVAGNGFFVELIPSYGGMPVSPWGPRTGGVNGANQTSLSTSVPDGFMHWLEQGGVWAGSEDVPFTLTEQAPTGTSLRYYAKAVGNVADANGFTWTAYACVYPGDPGFVAFRFDLHNPTASAISLAGSDGLEMALIGGLQQADTTWAAANGGYGTVGGSNVSGWPGDGNGGGGAQIDADYVYITPAAGGTSDSLGLVNVKQTKLSGLGWGSSVTLQYLKNTNRLKLKVMGTVSSVAAGATQTIYAVMGFSRAMSSTLASAIAKDYLTPGTPTGPFTGFSYDERAYVYDGTGNNVTLQLDTAAAATRYKPVFKFSNWTDNSAPVIQMGGVTLSENNDYLQVHDTGTNTLYLQLAFDVVASGAGAGQRNNASLQVSAPAAGTTQQGAASASGHANALLSASIGGQNPWPVTPPLLPAQRGLQVLHAGQDISQYVMEDEEGDQLHVLVSGDGIALGGGGGGGGAGATALKVESTLAQGAGASGAAGANATFTVSLGPAAKAKGNASGVSGKDIVRQGDVIIKDAAGNTIFGGTVTKLDDATEGVNVRTVFNCVDYWMSLDRIEVQQVYTGMGDTDIIRALCSTYAPWLDVSLVPGSQNYFFARHVCKGTLREVLQGVANITGFLIWADVNKRLRYLSPTSADQATFTLSDTPDNVNSFGYALTKYEVDDNAIINRCYFYGGKNTSPDFTQDLAPQANGSNKVFMLAYPPENASDGAKHITLNGVDLAVGSIFDTSAKGKLKSAGGTSDVLLNAGARIAVFDVAPLATDTLTSTYRYQTPLVVVLSSQQSYNFYGGWYDGRITDSNVFDPQTAIQQCKLKLAQQAFGLVHISLTTWQPGLQAGQIVRLVNSVRGINDTFLIQKVTANPLGAGQFSYDVDLGAWNWNLLDLLVEGARILNPTDGYSEEDTTVIQAHETTDATSAVTVINTTTHASGQYYSGQPATLSGFFTVTG